VTTSRSPAATLLSCVDAFNKRDAVAIAALADDRALFEIPMLKPNRLHGRDEISRGIKAAFKELKSVELTVTKPAETDSVAIAEGRLIVTRNSAPDEDHQVGIVAEVHGNQLVRFSLYLNARSRRFWSDETIL
jgi:hypothetical protein